MADKITWANKESLVTDPTILEKNKVTDSNMNEIKSVVNDNADNLDELIVEGEENITENTKAVIKEGVIRHFTEISNTYGTSESIGYSQKYQNAHNVIVSADTPTTSERVWFKKSNNLFNNLVISNTSNGASGTILSTGIRAKVTTAGTNKYVGYKLPNPEQLLGKVVTISATITKSGSNDGLIRFYWANGDTITTNINTAISSTGNKTFTMPSAFPSGSNQILIVFSATASNTGAVGDYVDYTNVMLEYGETATPYTQYGLNSINVDGEEIYNQNVMNYSTTEQVVGKWVDGKPLYRKVFNITNPASTNTNYVDISSMNIDTATHLYGYYKTNAGTFGIPFHDSNDNMSVMFISGDNNLYIRGRFGNNYTSITEVKVILEYTKTID